MDSCKKVILTLEKLEMKKQLVKGCRKIYWTKIVEVDREYFKDELGEVA